MNPLLQKTIDLADQSIKPEYQKGYHAILAAGLKAMFSDQTFHFMKDYLKTVRTAAQIPEAVSHGIVKLLSILWNESKGKMQLEPVGSAAMVLMAHALDYVESAMKIPIDKDTLGKTTELVNKGFLHFLKTASGLSDTEFEQVMRGQGKQLMEAQQAAGGAPPSDQPPSAAPAQPAEAGLAAQGAL
jgi:hypothetical protein